MNYGPLKGWVRPALKGDGEKWNWLPMSFLQLYGLVLFALIYKSFIFS